MESRAFIKYAAVAMKKIVVSDPEAKPAVQKEINQLFVGLHNPTLPSASKLRDVALRNGYTVDAKVQHRIQAAEQHWN